jgi:hypothetical protein
MREHTVGYVTEIPSEVQRSHRFPGAAPPFERAGRFQGKEGKAHKREARERTVVYMTEP